MDQEKIGKFIQEQRREKGLTQKEFAEKLNTTDKTVSRWENGHYLPDVSLFSDICEILEIEVTELLKGEKMKDSMKKEEVDETIMKIVDISNDKIQKNKKKTFTISVIIISLMIGLFGAIVLKKGNTKNKPHTGDLVPFPSQIAVKEKEDGWVCHFEIEYMQDNAKIPYYYGYDCDNFKYEELYDFMPTGTEMDDSGTYEYKTTTNHPQYSYNKTYSGDMKNIAEYFKNKQFYTVIEMSDLEQLELKYISKEEILELYNEAISSPKILKWGKEIMTQHVNYMITSLTKDDYTWKVGYIINFGHIKYVHIELMIKDVYLSDLIKEEKATEEQKELYQTISEIEKYIIEKQTFELPKNLENKRPYQFLKDNFSEIKHLED